MMENTLKKGGKQKRPQKKNPQTQRRNKHALANRKRETNGQGNRSKTPAPEVTRELSLGRRVGSLIYLLRCSKHWSQQVVAVKLDLSQSMLSLIESGKREVTLDFVEDVAKVFDLKPSVLLELCEQREKRGKGLAKADKLFDSIMKDSLTPRTRK